MKIFFLYLCSCTCVLKILALQSYSKIQLELKLHVCICVCRYLKYFLCNPEITMNFLKGSNPELFVLTTVFIVCVEEMFVLVMYTRVIVQWVLALLFLHVCPLTFTKVSSRSLKTQMQNTNSVSEVVSATYETLKILSSKWKFFQGRFLLNSLQQCRRRYLHCLALSHCTISKLLYLRSPFIAVIDINLYTCSYS